MNTSLDVDDRILICLQKYSEMVFRLAYQSLRSQPDAEDISQEVFLKLFTLQPDFESESHEKAWVIRVTINLCRDSLRSAWRKKRADLSDAIPHTDENTDVLDAVMRMPVKFRNVIYLHYYEGMSVAEIARALQQKENTISSWLHRARQRLKKSLEGGFDDE